MSLVSCPQCEKTVLDVASRCPHCGYVLTQARRTERHSNGYTMECHRCGVRISADSPVCVNCGVQDPHPRRSWFTPALLAVSAALVVLAFGGSRIFAGVGSMAQTRPFVEPEPQEMTLAAESQVMTPVLRPMEAVRPAPPTERRWTMTWVNVRESRGTTSEVVRVLDPGLEVDVRSRQGNWWELVMDGRSVGYVANSVLTRDPTEIPPNPRAPLISAR